MRVEAFANILNAMEKVPENRVQREEYMKTTGFTGFTSAADKQSIEAEMSWEARGLPQTMYDFLSLAKLNYSRRPACSFQITSGPTDKAETLTWEEVHAGACQTANLLRDLGVQEYDTVAYMLPNCNEAVLSLLGGSIAGIVSPLNPLLDAEQIAAILRETNAKVLITLKSFPKSDVAQKAAEAVRLAPNVETILEIDLLRYLSGAKRLIVPMIRPKNKVQHHAKVLDFHREIARQPSELKFEDSSGDRVGAYFHTGGTTGMPKVAQHKYSGMIYNGWIGSRLIFSAEDNIMCPLPLFHVFACHVIFMSAIASGAHVVFPTPQGYRGDGVFDNFWKLVERWKISFIITVPTAVSALMQRPVDADVSSVKTAFSGSAPMPMELFRRFESAAGVTIVEGYGLTEATCLVSCNPPSGEKKVGSVGIPFPHTDVRIIKQTENGPIECETDEVGEICIASPGVFAGHTYTDPEKNRDLFYTDAHLRTGDLGRLDEDGYLWITGRRKDLIIRGGHNIDPAEIEEALLGHPAVAFAGAIGQPDAHSGELPCAYVELCDGASVSEKELLDFANERIHERAARPKYLEILPELPKTAVGKVFKPDLRRSAISRVYSEALAHAGVAARVTSVVDDKKRGLVARIEKTGTVEDGAVERALAAFTRPWEWAG
ncbi:fatty-acyl-CoA synthase/long-chain acyl-CoA synthetase [Poseidonocella pacifica]|uniref:Fatty-acyl-CoA synthase/long-chain acyl-CoA synthetase n=2 Tax=Poseidonocella pacifica TaxID=871651 RepID=A0A1I0V8E3_9RHOB|nr:fatty-acyl-CoA synthase/long-chain acyl-CoA synthetase [Poseidonocella pacifica]